MVTKVTMVVLIIFLLALMVAWTFYFKALQYMKKKSIWRYTGIGPIMMERDIKRIPEPGHSYALTSLYIFAISIILFIITIFLLRVLMIL